MLNLNVIKPDVGKRADVFVAEKLSQYSRSSLSGLFDKQMVQLRKLPIKASYRLRAGDKLVIDTSLLDTRPSAIELPVIYEDDNIIVVNKPSGVLTHSKGALNTEATVASWFLEHLKKNNYNIKTLFPRSYHGNRVGIVHRLDRHTSGVIICAKNEPSLKWLQKQFSTRKTKKIYTAIVEGIPKPAEAIIDAPIERNPKKPQIFRVSGNGKPAQTKYKLSKILNPSTPFGAGKSYSILELQPLTGRTHQLRVHLKYIGHSIVGDKVYGKNDKHMYLHARRLEIILPDGKLRRFEAKEPDYFKKFRDEAKSNQ